MNKVFIFYKMKYILLRGSSLLIGALIGLLTSIIANILTDNAIIDFIKEIISKIMN